MTGIPPAADGRTAVAERPAPPAEPRPPRPRMAADIDGKTEPLGGRFMIGVFTFVPFAALVAAIPLMWGWGLS
jgi:stearoyl-CoA desaturase (Delta-9 desaturase)